MKGGGWTEPLSLPMNPTPNRGSQLINLSVACGAPNLMLAGVGHKNFRVCYDPGNIFYYSDGKLDPVDDVASVDGLVAGVNVKDFRLPKEVLVTPGTGMVDFRRVFAGLQHGGFRRGSLLLECLERGEAAQVTAEAVKARKFLEELTGQKA